MATPKLNDVQVEQTSEVTRSGAVISILLLVVFLGNSDNQMVSPLLPLIAREYNLDVGHVGSLILPAYSIAAAVAALFVGPLSDRYGRRRFLSVASILFGASLALVILVKNLWVLAGLRVVTGMAAGIFSTCSIAYVADYFPYKRRGVAMSVVQAGIFVALVLGVPIANQTAQWRGWRSSFLFFGGLSLIVFLLVFFVLPDERNRGDGFIDQEQNGDRFRKLKVAFSGRDRIAAIAAAFCVSCGFLGFFAYLGAWLRETLGLTTFRLNIFFVLTGIALLLGAFAAGPIADKLGKRGPSIVSSIVLAVALIIIPRLGWGIALFGVFLTAALAFAFRQGPLQALATELVPRQARGTFVSIRNTASQIGIAISAIVCGRLYDDFGYSTVGFFSGAVTLAAAVCILILREPKLSEAPSEGGPA